jgi:hypothetical protein
LPAVFIDRGFWNWAGVSPLTATPKAVDPWLTLLAIT